MSNKFFKKVVIEKGTGRITSLTIAGKPKAVGVKKISSRNGKATRLATSAINAATDYFKFGRYNNPANTVGLHLFTDVDEEELTKVIGYVSVDYEGDAYPSPNPGDFPLGWAPLEETLGRVKLGTFNFTDYEREQNRLALAAGRAPAFPYGTGRHAQNVSNKHNIIDLFIMGFQLEIRTLPIHKVAKHHLAIWSEEDIEVAREMSQQAYFTSIDSERRYQKASSHARGVQRGEREAIVTGQSLMVPVFGSEKEVNMFDLAPGRYTIRDHAGRPNSARTRGWDPDNSFKTERWASEAAHIQIELELAQVS